ncbi:hypothetical protein F2Q70_00018654 [Brassica cretica]|uniref:Uncharacterized protein n=1 Tax=Brassica cretica TaxID=69181 RepID=A0A8S9HUU2_BRACR|nr:hypothetical protein F2Q70_00018654 [Brassica cretica]
MCIITITRGSRFGGRGGSLRGRDSWGGDDNRRVTEDHQAAELLPRRGVLEVLASIVGVQDTWQQIVLIREGQDLEVEEAHYEDVIVGEVMITEEVEAVVEDEAAGPVEVVPEVVLMIG